MSNEERVVIVDDSNRELGAAPRSRMRARNLAYRATYILVLNDAREVFVQKRTLSKDMYPGYLDAVAGGVLAEGERYDASAYRELREELGVRGSPLVTLFDFRYRDDHNTVFGRAYLLRHNGPFSLQAEEIEYGFFAPISGLLNGDHQPLTPDGIAVLERFAREHTLAVNVQPSHD